MKLLSAFIFAVAIGLFAFAGFDFIIFAINFSSPIGSQWLWLCFSIITVIAGASFIGPALDEWRVKDENKLR